MITSSKPLLRPLVAVFIAAVCAIALAQPARAAYDAGVEKITLADGTPGAVSYPFDVLVGQTGFTPQPARMRVAIEGFELDPAKAAGVQIGSADYYTDLGDYLGNPITSQGESSGDLSWEFDTGLGAPVDVTVDAGMGLNAAGAPVATADTTLISFELPLAMPLGAKLEKIGLRFNENYIPEPSPGVGAVNPEAGVYLVRTWVQSRAPQSATNVKSMTVTVGNPPKPKTSLKVTANRKRVKAGQKVNFSLRTLNGTSDTVAVWLLGRRIRSIKVAPKARTFSWKATRKLRGRKVSFAFTPKSGPTRRVSVKITR